jgi:hypothetical protein
MNQQATEWRPWIVLVGGFLGAGKTSLILCAAQLLEGQGVRSAVILNDQGGELVDTHYAELLGVNATDVTGGCFCCRFSQLVLAIEQLRTLAPEVIFAEPVGSCTDISATVLGPLREDFGRYRIAPLTVLIDPARAAALETGEADVNVDFLMQKQLQEADLVCLSKSDIRSDSAVASGAGRRYLSAKTGQGVQEWLDEVLSGSLKAGTSVLDIDYEQYARAEAALAWLNLSLRFEPAMPASPAAVVGPFLDGLDRALNAAKISIVHLKLIDSSPSGWLKAALCANGDEPTIEGMVDASPAHCHELRLNLRALGDPAAVRATVSTQLELLVGTITELRLECFSPAAPVPERRITPVSQSIA